ncbi:MAG: AAA family ATPase [Minisyncoccia bacterium]
MRKLIISAIQKAQETPVVGALESLFGLLPEPSQLLTAPERRLLTEIKKRTLVLPPKSNQRVIAMVGLTGDGKTHVAHKLAREYDATLLSSDAIRVTLHNEACSYQNVNTIVRRLLSCVLLQNGSVVLDSDHVPPNKRNSLNRALREFGLVAEYVRVLARPEDALQWIRDGKYEGTIYDAKILKPERKSGGWRLKMSERERHFAWHYREDGTPRKFLFPHTEVWNQEM